jgi:hypothetical protein
MQNSLGNITEAMDLEVYYGPNKKKETFFIINLGGDEMLLGYPFLSNTMLSPQRGFVHTLRFRRVCGPKCAGAHVQTPEMCIDWYSPITKLRRQKVRL